MPNCIVRGCPHKTAQKDKYPNVSLHYFPNDLNAITNWLRQTGQYGDNLESVANEIHQSAKTGRHRICSVHFTEDSFFAKGPKRMLKPNAVPTIFDIQPTPVLVTAMESLPFQSHKRRRVEDDIPSTSHSIVRIVKHFITVATQTEEKIYVDASTTSTDIQLGIHKASGSDNPHSLLDIGVQTGDDSVAAEPWKIQKDHGYPVAFSTPIKCMLDIEKPNPNLPEEEKDTSIYEPEESVTFTEDDSTFTEKKEEILQRSFIVFEELLDQLFYLIRCQHSANSPCHAPIVQIQKKLNGTMVEVKLTCLSGHCSLIWNSQPLAGQISIGNVSVACAILLSGSSFTKVKEMFQLMSIPFFSHTTYYTYQKRYLFPAIDLAWIKEQELLKEEIADKAVVLAGDGQFDSPGYSAKYCTYTMMDIMTKKILHFTIEQIFPGQSSGQMEGIAFKKCLSSLEKKGIDVRVMATDRHSCIRSMMKVTYPTINHQFDVWHICKSLVKKLTAASKKRKYKDIAHWIGPITNHLWWCSQTCDHNVDNLLDKWRSVLYHIANKHTFRNLKTYKKYKKWITPSHPAYSTLVAILNSKQLMKDITQIEKFCHTGDLENYHSKVLKYRPKRIAFKLDSMYARTMLAALSHNKNVDRPQATVHCIFPKHKKEWVAKPIFEEISDVHLFDIISDAGKIVKGDDRQLFLLPC
uniref:THAP-type domain-containing protein n=1 Tax=Xenopus tropicalis TaxID=8364 RepID=A0A803J2M4_XENTR